MNSMMKAGLSIFALSLAAIPAAHAQVGDPFIGEMRMFPATFCPDQWAEAAGQLLPISSNQALFSLYGTQFGGDGRTSFALPDLRGRVPVGIGEGPGLSIYQQGQSWGVEDVTLTVAELPAHSHQIQATADAPDVGNLNGHGWGEFPQSAPGDAYNTGGALNEAARPETLANNGGNLAHNNIAPVQVTRFCVALNGLYPSRN